MIWDVLKTKAEKLRAEARGMCVTQINERNGKLFIIRPPEAVILFNKADRLYFLASELEDEFATAVSAIIIPLPTKEK